MEAFDFNQNIDAWDVGDKENNEDTREAKAPNDDKEAERSAIIQTRKMNDVGHDKKHFWPGKTEKTSPVPISKNSNKNIFMNPHQLPENSFLGYFSDI